MDTTKFIGAEHIGIPCRDIEETISFYEKLGFRTIRHDYYERENFHSYYMMYDPDGTLFEEIK